MGRCAMPPVFPRRGWGANPGRGREKRDATAEINYMFLKLKLAVGTRASPQG